MDLSNLVSAILCPGVFSIQMIFSQFNSSYLPSSIPYKFFNFCRCCVPVKSASKTVIRFISELWKCFLVNCMQNRYNTLSIFFTNSAIVSPSCSPRYVFPLRTGIEVGLINSSCQSQLQEIKVASIAFKSGNPRNKLIARIQRASYWL